MSTKLNEPENEVRLMGRICKPPRLFTSKQGKPQLILNLAVPRPANVPQKIRADGKSEPDYPPVVIEGEVANQLAAFLKVGDPVNVLGIFQTRNYTETQADGTKRPRVAMEALITQITLPRPAGEIDQVRSGFSDSSAVSIVPIQGDPQTEMPPASADSAAHPSARKNRKKNKNRRGTQSVVLSSALAEMNPLAPLTSVTDATSATASPISSSSLASPIGGESA